MLEHVNTPCIMAKPVFSIKPYFKFKGFPPLVTRPPADDYNRQRPRLTLHRTGFYHRLENSFAGKPASSVKTRLQDSRQKTQDLSCISIPPHKLRAKAT